MQNSSHNPNFDSDISEIDKLIAQQEQELFQIEEQSTDRIEKSKQILQKHQNSNQIPQNSIPTAQQFKQQQMINGNFKQTLLNDVMNKQQYDTEQQQQKDIHQNQQYQLNDESFGEQSQQNTIQKHNIQNNYQNNNNKFLNNAKTEPDQQYYQQNQETNLNYLQQLLQQQMLNNQKNQQNQNQSLFNNQNNDNYNTSSSKNLAIKMNEALQQQQLQQQNFLEIFSSQENTQQNQSINQINQNFNRNKSKSKHNIEQECSFRPMLSKKSIQIASKLTETSRERLHGSQIKTKQKIQNLKQEMDKKICSFTPKINRTRSHTSNISQQQYNDNNNQINIPVNNMSKQQFQNLFYQQQQDCQDKQQFLNQRNFSQNKQKQNQSQVFNRLYENAIIKQNEKENLKNIKEASEQHPPNCTFRPQINKKNQTSRSPYSQIERSQEFIKYKQEKLEMLRKQTSEERQQQLRKNCTFTPKIKENYSNIYQNQNEENLFYAKKGCEQFYERQDKAKRTQQEKSYKMENIGKGKKCEWTGQTTVPQEFKLSKNSTFCFQQKKNLQLQTLNDIKNSKNFNQKAFQIQNNHSTNNVFSEKMPLQEMEQNYNRLNKNKAITIAKDPKLQIKYNNNKENNNDSYQQQDNYQQKQNNNYNFNNQNLLTQQDLNSYSLNTLQNQVNSNDNNYFNNNIDENNKQNTQNQNFGNQSSNNGQLTQEQKIYLTQKKEELLAKLKNQKYMVPNECNYNQQSPNQNFQQQNSFNQQFTPQQQYQQSFSILQNNTPINPINQSSMAHTMQNLHQQLLEMDF